MAGSGRLRQGQAIERNKAQFVARMERSVIRERGEFKQRTSRITLRSIRATRYTPELARG